MLGRVNATAGNSEVYEGMYGPWSVTEDDLREVAAYRAGLTVAATALVLGALPALAPDSALYPLLRDYGDALCVSGAAGLGVSLTLIHIYVTPLKRFVQGLYGVGSMGGLYLMATQEESLPLYVMHHPGAMWLVGPFFAAVTGLAFKEGLCYGKAESAALFFVVPTLCLAHLSGACPDSVERLLLAAFAGLVAVFAARKYSQNPKDDIGDKSVFTFKALAPEEQQRVLADLRARKAGGFAAQDTWDDGQEQ